MVFSDNDENRSWVKTALSNRVVRVVFEKKDGTEREMFCTTSVSLVPADKAPKETGRAVSKEAQRVFDLDLGEWRSFRWDSLKTAM